jgi:hypothetical protein
MRNTRTIFSYGFSDNSGSYMHYCSDGVDVGLQPDKPHDPGDWLNDLDDNALTAIRDCFIARNLIYQEQLRQRQVAEAQTSAML